IVRLLLNSETRSTNGEIKPCQSPSQNPATAPCSLAVPADSFAPGAHPARMLSNSSTSTTRVKEDLIAIPPLPTGTKHEHRKSQNSQPNACWDSTVRFAIDQAVTALLSAFHLRMRSSRRTFTVWPASLPMALRISSFTGNMCLPSPIAMKEPLNGRPSIVPLTFTRPRVPKNFTELGQTT